MTDRPHILLAHHLKALEAADLPAGIRESGAPMRETRAKIMFSSCPRLVEQHLT